MPSLGFVTATILRVALHFAHRSPKLLDRILWLARFLTAMEFAVPAREEPLELMTPTDAGMATVGVFLCSIISGS